jgi:hypothetical protein
MADPSHFIAAKIAAAIGGLFGGASMMTFIRPKSISEAFIRGGLSTGCAIIFSTPVIHLINLTDDWEIQLMTGGIIGFLAYSILGAVANFFIKNEQSDIFELVTKVKNKTNLRAKK